MPLQEEPYDPILDGVRDHVTNNSFNQINKNSNKRMTMKISLQPTRRWWPNQRTIDTYD